MSVADINAGAAQRSRVTDLELGFGSALTAAQQSGLSYTLTRVRLPNGTADGATAISSTGASPRIAVGYATVNGVTVATLSFPGADSAALRGTSLADGVWQLKISSGGTLAYISPTDLAVAGGIYRLFGDVNGDRSVDFFDSLVYDPAFGSVAGDAGYVAALDSNADGSIDFLDALDYDPNFGVYVS